MTVLAATEACTVTAGYSKNYECWTELDEEVTETVPAGQRYTFQEKTYKCGGAVCIMGIVEIRGTCGGKAFKLDVTEDIVGPDPTVSYILPPPSKGPTYGKYKHKKIG